MDDFDLSNKEVFLERAKGFFRAKRNIFPYGDNHIELLEKELFYMHIIEAIFDMDAEEFREKSLL